MTSPRAPKRTKSRVLRLTALVVASPCCREAGAHAPSRNEPESCTGAGRRWAAGTGSSPWKAFVLSAAEQAVPVVVVQLRRMHAGGA